VKTSHRTGLILVAAASLAAATFVISAHHATAAAGDTSTGTGTVKTINAAAVNTAPGNAKPAAMAPTASGGSASSNALAPNAAAAPQAATGSSSAKKPAAPAASNKIGANVSSGGGVASPNVAPTTQVSFDGVNQATACGTCFPPDVSAAVGQTEIAQMVNGRLRVTNKTGTINCDLNLPLFLGTDDSLAHPRIIYDTNANQYAFVVSVVPANDAMPAIWAAISSNDEACGIWNASRITFTGNDFPGGTQLVNPILGQDRNALLVSSQNVTPSGTNFTSFAILKSQILNQQTVTVTTFDTGVRTSPATNAGAPLLNTSSSFFIAAIPGTGYRIFRLTNPGQSNQAFSTLFTVTNRFSAPSRQVRQPNTTATLDPGNGTITAQAVFDGQLIWFTHGIDLSGFPSVRYGAISPVNGGMATATAFRSSNSDDFNPSIAIALTSGEERVFLDWNYTDTSITRGASPTIDTVNPGSGVPNLNGTGISLLNGSVSTTQSSFGSFSSFAIDPTAATNCAVSATEYFQSDGTWRTRVTRVGSC
jgi:hypothetical protein